MKTANSTSTPKAPPEAIPKARGRLANVAIANSSSDHGITASRMM